MTRPLRIEFGGAFYHITARGNEKKPIFLDDCDRTKFKEIIQKVLKRTGAIVHCYGLMDNHYHLLPETPRGNISKAMHDLNTSYTVYFNKRHKRVGHLFQGRFKGILIEKDAYLLELSRYIHLNPVRAGLVKRPEDYKWSSYRGYIGLDEGEPWVQRDWTLSQFGSTEKESMEAYKKFVQAGIALQEKSPMKDVYAQTILGTEKFVEKIKTLIKDNSGDRDLPSIRMLSPAKEISWNNIIRVVSRFYNISAEKVRAGKSRPNIYRQIGVYLARKYTDRRTREIGEYFGGVSDSAVTMMCSRLEKKRERNSEFAEKISNIEKELLDVEV
ncbi:hypothetical protein AUJ66_02200 [Candidatus Desantisbacteria bacterium CG1_02_38_46]|uniref:Chromosomal replication initiator protein DnaA n=3 Tax=unclassified Candidatus Desantisiibacteriota TaxID=3106372 RepID=A0A2H9P9X7_9BACT|nr:MAG: hypothetical protein AUJ66_02200 [Candidatus Desantisbacteria bacterium CG1_02_38_46]PIU51526.1 MAG: hypothetical protein COS91_03995 [Candidatus Desantisbacteria bacterium CG07_land_8_20_14_0_80_39_15]PIZ15084.1 MAG: hypothetical protein COY51_06350 [Candidatus Desantisbacteria bacterium CG_4_10_14_0_8_um_filter_39_17]